MTQSKKEDRKQCNSFDCDNYLSGASCNDMTGLTPTTAKDSYETNSYEAIYPYLPPLPTNPAVPVPDNPLAEGMLNLAAEKKELSQK